MSDFFDELHEQVPARAPRARRVPRERSVGDDAFTKGFNGCLGVGCAIVVVPVGFAVLGLILSRLSV